MLNATQMKNILLILFFFMATSTSVFGQAEMAGYKKAAAKFESLYNEGRFEEIFNLFSPEMQAALPLDKTSDFFGSLTDQAGKILSREFELYQKTYALYKTQFERALLAVNISVDANEKINGLFIKPYQPQNLPKLERNTSSLILPFKGEWTVFWGGDTEKLNYHVSHQAQKHAFDFVMTNASGKSYRTDG